MRKLCFSENKTLRLTNVLSFKVDFEDEDSNLNIVIDQMIYTFTRCKSGRTTYSKNKNVYE